MHLSSAKIVVNFNTEAAADAYIAAYVAMADNVSITSPAPQKMAALRGQGFVVASTVRGKRAGREEIVAWAKEHLAGEAYAGKIVRGSALVHDCRHDEGAGRCRLKEAWTI